MIIYIALQGTFIGRNVGSTTRRSRMKKKINGVPRKDIL